MIIRLRNFIVPAFFIPLSFATFSYPDARRDESETDDYFGTKVPDPYRWLEKLDSSETQAFLEQQLQLTDTFLNTFPQKDIIRKRLIELWNYPKSSVPIKKGGRYFTFRNSGLEDIFALYVQYSLNEQSREVTDASRLSSIGTVSSPDPYDALFDLSRDGEIFAYAVQANTGEWRTIYFRNVSTGVDLPDQLKDTNFPFIQWSANNKGIFYTRLSSSADNLEKLSPVQMVYYHTLGTPQSKDILVAHFPKHPNYFLIKSRVSDDGNYLVISPTETFNKNAVYMFPLKDGIDETLSSKMVPLFPNATDATYNYVGNEGSMFLFQTNKDASNFKLITATVPADVFANDRSERNSKPQAKMISTFLKEHPNQIINSAVIADSDKLLVSYLEDVKHTMELRSLKNATFLQEIDLPAGSISNIFRENNNDFEVFFSLQSFVSPGSIYRCTFNMTRANCIIIKQLSVNSNTDLNEFRTEQVSYPSKDGTMVPMYIVRKNDTVLNGTTPALLWGYGGFALSSLPTFSPKTIAFVDSFNGVYAVANVRGGGEYGYKWYIGGSKLNKQNSFDDFQAAAEYLIQKNYTSAAKLTIEGASNGGLMVAACVNQRPELFGAAVVEDGLLDMIRVSESQEGMIACKEYGCPDDKKTFENVFKYSPLHNIRLPTNESVQYPAVLVSTAQDDATTVAPWHSYKYIAELQHVVGQSPRQTRPFLLLVDENHSEGKSAPKQVEEAVSIFSFMAKTLNVQFKNV